MDTLEPREVLSPGRVRLTRRAWLHLLLGGVLYAAGANVRSGWVLVIAGVVLAVVPWAWWRLRHCARRVIVARDLPAQATAGVVVPARLRISVPAGGPGLLDDELTRTVAELPPGGGTQLIETTAVLRRGRVSGGSVEVQLHDPFGIGVVAARGGVAASCEVLPAVRGGGDRLIARIVGRFGHGGGGRVGAGVETAGVRGYRSGDPLRAIAWRASARHDRLVVRELIDEASPRLRVALAGGLWDRELLDHAAEVACAVAAAGHRAGLATVLACDGATVPWGPRARSALAALPPHSGAAARPLSVPPASTDELTVTIAAAGRGVVVLTNQGDDLTRVVPVPAAGEGAGRWLAGW